jgi:hypothetical protein
MIRFDTWEWRLLRLTCKRSQVQVLVRPSSNSEHLAHLNETLCEPEGQLGLPPLPAEHSLEGCLLYQELTLLVAPALGRELRIVGGHADVASRGMAPWDLWQRTARPETCP